MSRPQRPCSIDGCDVVGRVRRGWCHKHYTRWHRHGDPTIVVRPWGPPGETKDFEDYWQVDPETNCWEWDAYTDPLGYARYKGIPAHRWSWEQVNGEVPDGLELDHLCANPPCVNPDHLEPVTHAENIRRGYQRKRAENPERHEPLDGVAHGEARGYAAGCRCGPCTEAHSARLRRCRQDRIRRLQEDPSLAEHGTASTYSNWGCRCDPCTEAHVENLMEYRSNREAA